MRHAQGVESLVPLDLEIESTLRRIRRARKNNNLALEFESEEESEVELKPEFKDMAEEEDERTLMELHRPAFGGYGSSIVRPTIQANTIEMKPAIIQMIQLQVIFGGSPFEDPNAHLENFMSICDTIKWNGVSIDAILLRLFPFSLQREAMEWLRDLPPGSITTWDGLVEVFMHRQRDGESLKSAWARFKKMLRMCPRHGFSIGQQVETFYYGVDLPVRSMIDAAANGSLYRKTPTTTLEIISNMAESNVGWQDNRREKKVGFLEMDALTAITAKLDGLTRQMAQLQANKSIPAKPVHQIQGNVEIVGGSSSSDTPFMPDMSCEGIQCCGRDSVNYVGNQENSFEQPHFNPPQHTTQQKPPQQPPKPPQGTGPSMPHSFKPQDSKSILEDMLAKYISGNEMRWQNHDAMMQRVETQLGQLATQMATRAPGSLPSDMEKNPKGVNAVTMTSPQKQEVVDVEENVQENGSSKQGPEDARKTGKSLNSNLTVDINSLPFPQRAKKLQLDTQYSKFLEIFKKLHIIIPFAEALAQIPFYAKFLMEILSNKRKLVDFETVKLSEECSAILKNKLPPKAKDPGSFSIPCTIRTSFFGKALCDLGSSINLMPYSCFEKLGIGEVRPTTISLQLADRSIKYPRGVVEDVLVKVDKFIFPLDFVV
ncbi:uncharacterized protein [Primulina eburnea]|uniref:uncharacterized protein n=1 Tax=Primulina eburnea TaxID=1245227 RepID=UPI003C6C909A